jgi:hypothetical protein
MGSRSDLSRRIGEIARRLLGEPNRKRSGRYQLRFGSNGSVAVEVGGPKLGTWYDHEAEIGGGPMDLVEIKGGMSREEAEAWLEQEGFAAPRRRAKAAAVSGARQIVATYDYRDEAGTLLFQVVRYELKDFRQRAPQPGGGWIWSTKNVRKVLYRLPELCAAPLDATVYIVEGEKDVETLLGLGLAATTAPGGAARSARQDGSKWRLEFIPFFEKRDVVVVPDNDESGRAHARTIAATLAGVAARVRILGLPGLADKGDVSDWIAAGGTREQIEELVRQTPESSMSNPQGEAGRGTVDGFEMRPDGLFFNEDTRDGRRVSQLSGPFEIAGVTYLVETEEYGQLVRFRDRRNRWREIDLPRADLYLAGAQGFRRLVAQGLPVEPGRREIELLKRYFVRMTAPETDIIRTTLRCGWLFGDRGPRFVLPDQVIGVAPGERIRFSGSKEVFVTSGTAEGWRREVAPGRCRQLTTDVCYPGTARGDAAALRRRGERRVPLCRQELIWKDDGAAFERERRWDQHPDMARHRKWDRRAVRRAQ